MAANRITDLLTESAKNKPLNGIFFIQNSGNEFLSYKELLSEASLLSNNLLKLSKTNNKIIIAVNNNIERVKLLWGCFLCGIIPTIVQQPLRNKKNDFQYKKMIGVYRTLGNPAVIVSNSDLDCWGNDEILGEKTVNYISLTNELPEFSEGKLDNDTAYIQFSSGTTGNPKGVVLTHKNILSNLEAIKQAIKINPGDISFNWLPLYHDMGLIGFHLSSVYNGVNQFLMETEDFVRNPLRLLDFINEHKITISGCPNFGQNLILKHLERRQGNSWDLSSVKVLFNGAEPISETIMTSFINKLATYKFNSAAMFPVYGLAEATLAVSFPEFNSTPVVSSFDPDELFGNKSAVESTKAGSVKYVSVGKAVSGCQIRIVNDDFNKVDENKTGLIQIKGTNVSHGYFGDTEPRENLILDNWLNTGDVGFFFDSRLYIIGRSKDTIIINGKNYNSTALESTAKKLLDNPNGKIFIIPADGGSDGDKILLFIAGLNFENSINAYLRLRRFFSRYVNIKIDELIPVASSEIPRTSSGKLKRFKLRENYETGKYTELITKARDMILEIENHRDKIPPSTVTEKILHKIWSHQLCIEPDKLGINENFYDFGAASIDVVDVLAELKRSYKISLNSKDLYSNITIKELASYIDKNISYKDQNSGSRKKFNG